MSTLRKHRRLSKRDNWKILRYENGNGGVYYRCKFKTFWGWITYKEYVDVFDEEVSPVNFKTLKSVEKFIENKINKHTKKLAELDVKVTEVKTKSEKREDNIKKILGK